MKAACVVAIAASMAAGCRSHVGRPPAAQRVGHIVVFWLKQPGDEAARRRIIEASRSFRSIPGVVAVEAGERLPSPRANVDKTFDVAVVMWFRDTDALEQYQVHPKHQAMLREMGPLVERAVVYDFTRPAPK